VKKVNINCDLCQLGHILMRIWIEHKQSEMIVKELGCLPLAIEQAGAYIYAQGSALKEYLVEYRTNFQMVTENRPEGLEGYATVYTTWQISLEAIKAENPASAQLLLLCGFLSNNVSDDLILHGEEFSHAGHISEVHAIEQLKAQIRLLLSYSLVKREVGKHRIYIHPVVHEWTRQHLTPMDKQQVTEHALEVLIRAIDWNWRNKSPEEMLAFSRDVLPDLEAFVAHVTDYFHNHSGPEHINWNPFNVLVDFLQGRACYQKSLILAGILNNAQEKWLGPEHPQTLKSMCQLAWIYSYQAKDAEAIPLLEDALRRCRKTLGQEHPNTLESMNNLGLVYWKLGKVAEAEVFYKEALSGYETTYGHGHPATVLVTNNLALLYGKEGNFFKAEHLYKEALSVCEEVFAHDQPTTHLVIANLASLYRDQGKYTEAEPLHKKALAGREKVLGRDHPNTLQAMNSLALGYWKQNRFVEAENLFTEVVVGNEKALGPEHPTTLYSMGRLASTYRSLNRFAEAEALYNKVLSGREKVLGDQHPCTLFTASQLAALHQKNTSCMEDPEKFTIYSRF
jgi:tetratricopeptide (TPR) repeat protein